LLDEAIALFRKTTDWFGLGWALHTRSLTALNMGDVQLARRLVAEALQLFVKAGDISGIVLLLDDAAGVERSAGNRALAIRLSAAAATHQAASGAGLGSILNVQEGRTNRGDLSGEEDERAWAEGQAMTIEQAVALALAGAQQLPAVS
jgi:hypothetical protein